MTFLPIQRLREGMVLNRDVYLFDSKTSRLAMLRSGGVLTQQYIDKLGQMGILGVYIQTQEDELETSRYYSRVEPQFKKVALERIRNVYETFDNTTVRTISVQSINQTIDITHQLVDMMIKDPNLLLNIEDLRLYDDYTYNHSLGVTILSISIGLSLAMTRNDLYDLALCALLHDIGKMGVPISIISKPQRLTMEEFEIVRQHPVLGVQYLIEHNVGDKRIRSGVLTHHERYDGTGYPNGLSGDDIPLFGRIISVADVYDALTSARPYRDPSTAPEAIEYIMGGSGKSFDIKVVKTFLKKVSPYPVGCCVKLSNGKTAIVIKQNDLNPLRPTVQLFEQVRQPLDLYNQRELQNVVIDEICDVKTDVIL